MPLARRTRSTFTRARSTEHVGTRARSTTSTFALSAWHVARAVAGTTWHRYTIGRLSSSSKRARAARQTWRRHTIEELAAHLEDIYLDAIRAGRPDAEAYRAATAALSESALRTVPRSRTRGPESRPVNEVPAGRGLNGLAADLKSAWRQWRRSPSFAAIAIITLGLGAGAATAIFSIVDTVLLRPLPFHEPQSLVTIWEGNPEKALPKERLSPVNFMDYRGVQAAFVDAAAWWRPEINLSEPGMEPVRVNAVETSGNLFQLLGVSAAHGPGFPQDGPFFSRDQIAVISDRLWRQRYNADPQHRGTGVERERRAVHASRA